MTDEVKIRKFKRSTDTKKLAVVLDRIYEDEEEGFNRFSFELMDINHYKQNYIAKPEFNTFVAEVDGAIVGFMVGRDDSPLVYEILMLYVLPEHRRKGIARGLKEYLTDYARSKKYSLIQSQLRTNNLASIHLNRSFGWIEVADRFNPDYYLWFYKFIEKGEK